VCVCVCVNEINSLPWFSKRTEKWLIEEQLTSWCHPYTSHSRINIHWVRVSVSHSAGAQVQVIFVSHSYQTWFTCFPEIGVFACTLRDHVFKRFASLYLRNNFSHFIKQLQAIISYIWKLSIKSFGRLLY